MFQRLFTLILCIFNVQQGERCTLNTRHDFREPLPIIIRNGRLLEPTDRYGDIVIEFRDMITLSCEGGGSITHPQTKNPVRTGTISCLGGNSFGNNEWLNGPASFFLFRCDYPPAYRSQRTNRTCFEGNPIIEVGYSIQDQWYPVYETCFDEHKLNPVYSKYTQKPYNARYQTRVDRPFFIDNDNYGDVRVNSLFSPHGQKAAVAQLVGRMIDTYFQKSEMLSRGHLAAKTDFVFAFTERATFHYVNCAPQWTGFNGGNWNTLEVDLRDHIHNVGYDTVIYTGTYGVSQLNNQYGNSVDIYLTTDDNDNPVIPVPKYFYKVVYEPSTKRGIAYVGINNPYYTMSEARGLFFCEDICRGNYAFSWLTWHPDNPSEGYTFCCTIPDFTLTVHHLPPLEIATFLFIVDALMNVPLIRGRDFEYHKLPPYFNKHLLIEEAESSLNLRNLVNKVSSIDIPIQINFPIEVTVKITLLKADEDLKSDLYLDKINAEMSVPQYETEQFAENQNMIEINRSEESHETKNYIDYVSKSIPRKRSVNIIEEENIATTASEFKFTGQETRLHNYLNFKNINS